MRDFVIGKAVKDSSRKAKPSIYDSNGRELLRRAQIAFGILLATILHRRTLRLGLSARLALLLVGIAAWVFVGNYCGLLDPFPTIARGMIGYPLMSLGCVAIFLSVLGGGSSGWSSLSENPKLVYLGKILYGLYAYRILSLQLSDH